MSNPTQAEKRESASEVSGGADAAREGADSRGGACRRCERQCAARKADAGATRKKLPKFGGAELAVGASWGCLSAWIFMCFKSLNIYTAVGEATLDMVYLVSIASLCVALYCAGHFDAAAERLLKRRSSIWLLPAFMVASTLLMPVGVYVEGVAGQALACVSGVLSGVASALFLLRIAMAFSKLCLRTCVGAAAAGTILHPLLFTLSLLFGPFESAAFAATMPVASSVLLFIGMKELVRTGAAGGVENECVGDADAATERGAELARSAPFDTKKRREFTVRLAIGGGLVGFASEAARTLLVQMGTINLGASSYALSEGAAWLVATVAITVLSLALMEMKTERMARNCYHTLLLLLVASALLLPVAFTHGAAFATAATAVNSATYSCFSMLIWVVVVSFAARHPNASLRIIATARAGWASGPLAGMLLGRLVVYVMGIDINSMLMTAGIAVMAILVGMCFAFSETDLARCMDVLPMQRKRRFRDKCLRLAKAGGLSERETEVMVLLAKGLSLAYIQEHLLMSKSTASTHRQHIYRKLDIHGQQELIEKVEAVAGD